MEIKKIVTSYTNPLTGANNSHHVLFAESDDDATPFDAVNLYLSSHAIYSLATSARYSGILLRFFRWYFHKNHYPLCEFNKIWLKVTENDIQSWQIHRAVDRIKDYSEKPSDKTIYDEACIIHDFYVWTHNNNYPVRIKPNSREFVFDFRNRENELLAHLPKSRRSVSARKSIKTRTKVFQQGSIRILSNDQIKRLLLSYSDPVYAFMYLVGLCTGLRPEGITKIPYVGVGKNTHILPWDQMNKTIGNNQKDFEFTVVEKGSKRRTIKINLKDWQMISEAYLPLCEERRESYRQKHGKYPNQKYYWLNKKGEPIILPKAVSDATSYAKRRGNLDFPCTFYDSRHWYATMYILNHLKGNELWREDGYNAAVDEYLRAQLGHENILTTYNHYVSVARLYASASGNLISEVAKEGGFVSSVLTKEDVSDLLKA